MSFLSKLDMNGVEKLGSAIAKYTLRFSKQFDDKVIMMETSRDERLI
jgi:hypothetical protein